MLPKGQNKNRMGTNKSQQSHAQTGKTEKFTNSSILNTTPTISETSNSNNPQHEREHAMKSIIILTKKKNGQIEARTCRNRNLQRDYTN